MLYPLFLICRFSFIPWIWIRNGVAALAALKCSGIAESINERNIFPRYVFFNIIHISVKAFVSRSEVGRRLQNGFVCSRPAFLHTLQMISKQAAGCSKHDHQHREDKNDRFLRAAARFVLLGRLLRLHALGVCELDNFAHFGFFPVFLPLCRFFCSSAVCRRSRLWLFSGVSGAWQRRMFPVICFAAGTRGVAGDGEKQYGGDHSEANTRVSEPCGDRAVYEQKTEPNQALDQRVLNAIMHLRS